MSDKGFVLIKRSQWGAKPPRDRTIRPAPSVTELYVHWPGAPGSLLSINTLAEEKRWMRDTQAFHQNARDGQMETARGILLPCGGSALREDDRGWNDLAYNYALFPSGRVHTGRGFRVVPASQAPHNTEGVSICVVLGAADKVPPTVERTLRRFVRWSERYAHHELRVRAHRDVNNTTCPGPRLAALVPALDRV